jgi:apolipoprotein N-acyltransferase
VVQANVPPELTWQRTSALTVLRAQLDLTRRAVAADGKPDLVVWPEMAVQTALDDAGVGAPLGAIARGGVPLLLGAPRSERGNGIRRDYNSALLLRTDGRTEHYDKRRLLPWSEAPPLGGTRLRSGGDLDVLAFTPGDRPGLFRLGDAALGVSICFEIAYPAFAREAAEAGASVLVNLSNDAWYRGAGGARQHLAQAVFRAIETGLPLVRATPTGISAVVAPDGRVVAALDEGHAGVIAAAVPPPLRGGTLHDRIGDLLPLGCALALLGAWIAAEAARSAVGSGRAAPPPHGVGASSSSEKLESVTISSGSIG